MAILFMVMGDIYWGSEGMVCIQVGQKNNDLSCCVWSELECFCIYLVLRFDYKAFFDICYSFSSILMHSCCINYLRIVRPQRCIVVSCLFNECLKESNLWN